MDAKEVLITINKLMTDESVSLVELASVSNFIRNQTNENEQLKKQLEGVIVPKHKLGEMVWWIDKISGLVRLSDIMQINICSHSNGEYWVRYYLNNPLVHDSFGDYQLFATREEAEQSLKGRE